MSVCFLLKNVFLLQCLAFRLVLRVSECRGRMWFLLCAMF